MRVSVIIPAYNSAAVLKVCLRALAKSDYTPAECIVVDDESTDETSSVARQAGVMVMSTGERGGPAKARNLAASSATGDLLVFVDADVALRPDALRRFVERFEADPDLDALVGSYDDAPAHPGFFSQFKNLMHSFVHHEGNSRASVFWCGCGAVKRSVYLEHGGLKESYGRPSIEDIEFGLRLLAASRKVVMDPRIQGKHLKAWTFWNLLHTDVFLRGIPWTELILSTRVLPNDLNLRWSQRVSAAVSIVLVLLAALLLWQAATGTALLPPLYIVAGIGASMATVLLINRQFYLFLASRKGWIFAFAAIPMHLTYYLYSCISLVLGIGSYVLRGAPTEEPHPPLAAANQPADVICASHVRPHSKAAAATAGQGGSGVPSV